MNIPESNNDFAILLRRQANAVFVACEEPVAKDLSASLNAAADRIIDLQRRAYIAEQALAERLHAQGPQS